MHVLTRLGFAKENPSYAATYKSAQQALRTAFPRSIPAQLRAYLLIEAHGKSLCKRTNPRCTECPARAFCVYFKQVSR